MSGTPEPKETAAWVGIALSLLIGALVGAIAGGVLAGSDADMAGKLGVAWTAAFLVGVVVTIFAVLAFHETGHLLFGRLVGFRFFLLVVGPLRIVREGEAVRVRWNRSLALAGGLAGTGPGPGDELRSLRRRMAWMVAGGPLTSLLLGLVLLVVVTGAWPPDLPPGGAEGLVVVRRLLWLAALASVSIGVITLIPARTSGFFTDGARILQILRGGDAAEADIALTTILAWSVAGIRPREWDPEIVEQALGAEAEPFRAVARHAAWRRALDRGREEEAAERRMTLVGQLDEAPAVAREAIALDLAVERALAGDAEEARRRIDEVGSPGPLTDPHLRPLARAALAATEGRWEEARSRADEAEELLDRALDRSARVVDEERLAELRDRIRSRADSPGA